MFKFRHSSFHHVSYRYLPSRAAGVMLGIVLSIVASGALFAAPARGMVLIPAGSANIGPTRGAADEQPAFRAMVAAFFLDHSPVSARGHATPDSPSMHVGFRCARSVPEQTP